MAPRHSWGAYVLHKRLLYFQIWKRDVHVLLISGQDDRALKSEILLNLFNCYPANRKRFCELHAYPGAGHLIEPPYAPLARTTTKHNRGVGGDYGMFKSIIILTLVSALSSHLIELNQSVSF